MSRMRDPLPHWTYVVKRISCFLKKKNFLFQFICKAKVVLECFFLSKDPSFAANGGKGERERGNTSCFSALSIKTCPARCPSPSSTPSSPFPLSCFFLFPFSSAPLPALKKIPPDRQRSPRSHSDIKTFPRNTHVPIFIPRNVFFNLVPRNKNTMGINQRLGEAQRHRCIVRPCSRCEVEVGVMSEGSYRGESAARVEFDGAAEGVDDGDAV